ncbi:multiple inositol polyphosphate phosphatase 1-like [Planococcus citri]|uniref:multiple inositol polyphosphate phosphatase 1-like n=1 Tax=Planococcus citri TaxID=170843 RepID=UPI0031F9DA78
MILIWVLLISSLLQIEAEQEQCYADNTSPYLNFGERTSYFQGREPHQMNLPKNCKPIYVWGIIRHGTRYPVPIDTILKIKKTLPLIRDQILMNHKNGRGNLCKKDLENLKKWNINITTDLRGELTSQGTKELIFLAKKIKEAFPLLFELQQRNIFEFQSSDTNRTRASALAFSNELMGTNFTTLQGNNITEDDEFLQLYKHCPNHAKLVKNPVFHEEIRLFKTSALMQKITAEISLRLGFLQPLSNQSIMLMYSICAYENAWFMDSKPPFCAVFTEEDLKAIEYYEDMESYYIRGYGNPLPNEKMGCPIVRDMMLSLSKAAKNAGNVAKGKFLFTHCETIIPTTVKLGLQKDNEPLKLENYQKLVEKRKWRSTYFDSFAANIMVALYRCPNQNGTQDVVIFHQNEHSVVIPQCISNPCTLDELQFIFQDVFDENRCNTNFCKISEPSKPSSGYLLRFSFNIIVINLLFIKIINWSS